MDHPACALSPHHGFGFCTKTVVLAAFRGFDRTRSDGRSVDALSGRFIRTRIAHADRFASRLLFLCGVDVPRPACSRSAWTTIPPTILRVALAWWCARRSFQCAGCADAVSIGDRISVGDSVVVSLVAAIRGGHGGGGAGGGAPNRPSFLPARGCVHPSRGVGGGAGWSHV